ncbi:hypothetical protein [Isoptericola sp. BMS4]|uniref:hypothetical protein n=1 Tax=Isoptericola sp. BMS4 TaxID=2527875 RepID=UPI00142460BE|nr:hypothetical protein [Isoptericola sp. BMS4]
MRRYRRTRWVVAAVGLLGGVLALVARALIGAPVFDGDWWAATLVVVIVAVTSALLIALLVRRYGARRDQLVAQVR